ncbi:MAG: hypothetical protein U9Q07_02315 [Planctomycetota bacterium]|nr:hypothetical protein [Planctomycetota bacterium]
MGQTEHVVCDEDLMQLVGKLVAMLEDMRASLDDAFIAAHDSGASMIFGVKHDPQRCVICRLDALLAEARRCLEGM